MHVRRAGDDRLGAADDYAVSAPLLHVHVDVGVCLLARVFRAVAFRVGHGDAECQVLVLHAVQIGEEALVIIRAERVIAAFRRLKNAVQRVMREITLRAAAFLADEPHRLELIEKIGRALVDMQHAVDDLAGRALPRHHQRLVLRLVREIVGDADAGNAGRQQRLVGDAVDASAIDEDARRVAAQRLAVIGGIHEHGRGPLATILPKRDERSSRAGARIS